MASSEDSRSSFPDPRALHNRQTARDLLRSHRKVLLDRLTSTTVKSLADGLYAHYIITKDELQDIQSDRTLTIDLARKLLSVMETRSWEQCVCFARLLHQTEGIEDIGKLVLQSVGLPVDSQSYESLEKENSQLRGENKALRSEHNTLTFEKEALRSENDSLRSDNDMLMKENKAQTRESKRMHDKAGQHQLMVTTLRHRPVQDTQNVKWDTLPPLPINKWFTINSVAVSGNRIAAAYCFAHELYTLRSGSKEWMTHKSVHGSIWNVFNYQETCYVTAGWEKHKIYQWNVDSNTWSFITSIPTHRKGWSAFSLTASPEHIYMLGGMEDQHLDTATVYDMKSQKWLPLPSMPFKSYRCSSVLIDNTLYVAGGVTTNEKGKVSPVTELSALHLNESDWKRLPSLKYGKATISALHGRLVATGGENPKGDAVNYVEFFDVTSNEWLPLPPLSTPRSLHGACVFEDGLAVVGGWQKTECEIMKFP